MSDVIDIKKQTKKSLASYTMLPLTMQQFEDLTNDLLLHINEHMTPHALDAEYLAQVLMSVIHASDRKTGKVRKEDLFEACVNTISRHVTYHAVEEIQKRIKAKAEQNGHKLMTVPMNPQTPAEDILPDEVRGELPPAPPTVS